MAGEQRINWNRGSPGDSVREYLVWRSAIVRADQGDTQPLIKLLRSGNIPGPEARELIADLLSRHKLTRKRGRQATPVYQNTLAEARLANQEALVRYFKQKGQDVKTAMELALREDKRDTLNLWNYTDEQIDKKIAEGERNALENLVYGRRGSTRRMRKRQS